MLPGTDKAIEKGNKSINSRLLDKKIVLLLDLVPLI